MTVVAVTASHSSYPPLLLLHHHPLSCHSYHQHHDVSQGCQRATSTLDAVDAGVGGRLILFFEMRLPVLMMRRKTMIVVSASTCHCETYQRLEPVSANTAADAVDDVLVIERWWYSKD